MMNRYDIHLISRYSNWTEKGIRQEMTANVYATPREWRKFLYFLFICLGAGFTISGIIFFFAYNWVDLHKFAKIGMVEGGMIIALFLILFSKFNKFIKSIILTVASVLVGILFSVFGQIYQTGANAYDFFLVWTVFISLWVLVSNFAPLWLIYLMLINTTLLFYSQQVAHNWSPVLIFTLLFLLNISFLVISIYLSKRRFEYKVPRWFTRALALASVTFSTIGISIGIHDKPGPSFIILLLSGMVCYAAGMKYGMNEKSRFYLSIIPFSVIIIINSLLVKISDGEAMLLFISVFVIASITLVIRFLIDIQKKWDHEQRH